jgi:hypothetical protein
LKCSQGTNTLAYFSSTVSDEEKSMMTLTPGHVLGVWFKPKIKNKINFNIKMVKNLSSQN